MPVTLSFSQIGLLTGIALAGVAMGLSRQRPIPEVGALVYGAHYFAIHSISWNYILLTRTASGEESVFGYAFTPFLPTAGLLLGVVAILMVIAAGYSVWCRRGQYARRQRLGFWLAWIPVFIGIVISARTPIAVQAVLDAMVEAA